MSVVAEKQVKTAAAPRRAFARAVSAWSAPATGHGVLRSIVRAPHARAAPRSGAAGAEVRFGGDSVHVPTTIRRGCAECSEDMEQSAPAQQAQRAIEVGPADDEHEREADAMAEAVTRTALPEDEDEVRRDALDDEHEPEAVRREVAVSAPPSTTAEAAGAVPVAAPAAGAPVLQRACAECTDELQRDALEADEEERVQREAEAPSFSDSGPDDEDGVRRLLSPRPQFAITVGPADDEYEREADAVADRVVRTSIPEDEDEAPATAEPAALRSLGDDEQPKDELQREEMEEEPLERQEAGAQRVCAECDEERAQRAAAEEEEPDKVARSPRRRRVGRDGGEIDDAELSARLRSPGSGRALPAGLRSFIEPRLPYDFSDVRVHDTDADREDAARLSARAFTYGRHIWIGPGESADNPRLMAHELTHVVQQGGARRHAVQRAGEGVGELDRGASAAVAESSTEDEPGFFSNLLSTVTDFVADQGWRLVRHYAPGLEPILRQGPFNWLKDQLARAFEGVVGTLNRLNPRRALDELAGLFDGLIRRAEPIVTALRAGDCGPLFQAIADLKNFVTEVAGAAWDRLTEFLRPVGDFFSDLWNGYGAPAVEWLQNFAGDVWGAIRQLGSDIWEWTRPFRERVGAAWNWLKERLFGPEDESSGDSDGGVVGWITRKAGEAWDWVKEQARPVWEPVVHAAEQIRELIPPAFIRRLGEQFQQLSAHLNQVNQEAEGGDDIAENRAALAAALPTVDQVIASVRGIIVGAGGWLQEKVGSVAGAFTGLLARLRGHSLLRPLAGLLDWLDDAAGRLAAWAQEKVGGLFDWILHAFDVLTPFVQRLVTTVRNLIGVVGNLMQLPSLVLNSVWNLIPTCIRNPIRDFIVNQILRRIPVFGTLLEIPDVWNRIESTALRILRQVFVDGNLAGAAWTFFRAVLNVLGIPPQLVVGILAKAASAIGDILTNPVGFLLNLLSAIKEGFSRFFDNIGTHLLNGVTGWLFGHLSRAWIQPPQDFSLRSILGFVLQVLDITMDRVFERLARRVDPAIVQRLRTALDIATGVWRFVVVLVNEGPAGLWREVQEQLGGLWDRVLDAVIGWITRTIIGRVTARLLTMLDPTGVMAVVNSLIALYRAIQSAIQYLREMLEIVDRVLDGINGIARGAIDIAAGFLERSLASGLPVAIGFLANQVGLGDVGERIREMVEGVRELVDRAIDWLIDRAIAGGQALINMLRRGVAAVRNWWAARKHFTSEQGGEGHDLYFEGSGTSARLMIRSDPIPYREFIAGVTVPPEKQAAKNQAMEIAGELDQAIARAGSAGPGAASTAPAATAGSPASGAAAADPSVEINDLLDRLAAATAQFMPGAAGAATPPQYGSLQNGFGTSVEVERLAKAPGASGIPGGQEAGRAPANDGWSKLVKRKPPDGSGGSYYVRGHLLNNNLGGPARWENLTPITQEANNRGSGSMLYAFENDVKTKVLTENKSVYFRVTAQYGRSHPLIGQVATLQASTSQRDKDIADIIRVEQNIPVAVDCAAYELDNGQRAGSPFKSARVMNDIDTRRETYDVRGG